MRNMIIKNCSGSVFDSPTSVCLRLREKVKVLEFRRSIMITCREFKLRAKMALASIWTGSAQTEKFAIWNSIFNDKFDNPSNQSLRSHGRWNFCSRRRCELAPSNSSRISAMDTQLGRGFCSLWSFAVADFEHIYTTEQAWRGLKRLLWRNYADTMDNRLRLLLPATPNSWRDRARSVLPQTFSQLFTDC